VQQGPPFNKAAHLISGGNMKLKRLLWLVLIELLGFGLVASAQQVSPLIQEAGKSRARGFITVTNLGLQNSIVVITPHSATFKDGRAVFLPLGDDVKVRLSQSSLKLGPKASQEIDFNVDCHSCIVVFDSSFMNGQRVAEGLTLALHVESAVYVCADKSKDCRKRTRAAFGK
jgi:hypothetical protein